MKFKDGLELLANESIYSKISKKLILIGNVVVFDAKKILKLEVKKLNMMQKFRTYNFKDETLSILMTNMTLVQKIHLLKSENIIKSNKKTILKDKFKNKLETDKFIYFINKKLFKSKNLFITDKDSNKYFSKDSAIDLSKMKSQLKILKFILLKMVTLVNMPG